MITKEMRAMGLAEMAWGQLLHWRNEGKLGGDLTYEEWRKAIEPLFLEAMDWKPGLAKNAEKAPSSGKAT